DKLAKTFPHVDVFMPPSEPAPLVDFLLARDNEQAALVRRHQLQDDPLSLVLPLHQQQHLVSAHVPVIYGCNHVCTFCIIPARRGTERSRPVGEIAAEIRSLVRQGVREVTLLGQIVDRYGFDIPDGPRLPDLLRAVHEIEDLQRIRFLTSHPSYMTDELLETVARLPKVCEHIEVPNQAGDDEVLRRMKREYSMADYAGLIDRIRARMPEGSIATDVIVGFPGETAAQFQRTLDWLADLKLDVCHVAMYSPRPGTVSSKIMADDVPPAEKKRRLDAVNTLQEQIVAQINARLLGRSVEILVEEKHRGRWKGRTRTNKLVFFEDESGANWQGQLVNVEITWTGPWSMRGVLPGRTALFSPIEPAIIPLSVVGSR
ncbi:MAG: MiaB/RimO family radical SAM methylthiotransferase, partial [Chloroflexota bacterium]